MIKPVRPAAACYTCPDPMPAPWKNPHPECRWLHFSIWKTQSLPMPRTSPASRYARRSRPVASDRANW